MQYQTSDGQHYTANQDSQRFFHIDKLTYAVTTPIQRCTADGTLIKRVRQSKKQRLHQRRVTKALN